MKELNDMSKIIIEDFMNTYFKNSSNINVIERLPIIYLIINSSIQNKNNTKFIIKNIINNINNNSEKNIMIELLSNLLIILNKYI